MKIRSTTSALVAGLAASMLGVSPVSAATSCQVSLDSPDNWINLYETDDAGNSDGPSSIVSESATVSNCFPTDVRLRLTASTGLVFGPWVMSEGYVDPDDYTSPANYSVSWYRFFRAQPEWPTGVYDVEVTASDGNGTTAAAGTFTVTHGTHVTGNASPEPVQYGHFTTMRGRATRMNDEGDYVALPKRKVNIWFVPLGAAARLRAVVTTGPRGYYARSLRMYRDGSWFTEIVQTTHDGPSWSLGDFVLVR